MDSARAFSIAWGCKCPWRGEAMSNGLLDLFWHLWEAGTCLSLIQGKLYRIPFLFLTLISGQELLQIDLLSQSLFEIWFSTASNWMCLSVLPRWKDLLWLLCCNRQLTNKKKGAICFISDLYFFPMVSIDCSTLEHVFKQCPRAHQVWICIPRKGELVGR